MTDDVWVVESPVSMIVGEVKPFSLDWGGSTDISSPTTTVYWNNEDISSDVLSGAESSTGTVQTSRTLTPLQTAAGQYYVVVFKMERNSVTQKAKLMVKVVDPAMVQI